ncbi:MAG: hypothetical protein ACO3A4_14640, partial [Silvanigrellaceae bacterium]
MPIPVGKSTPTLYAAYSVLATVVFVACFRPAPPLEEGDDRDSGLTEAPSPDGDTAAQGHPLLKKRQAAKALSLPTPSASSTPATGKTQTTAQTATTGSGVPNDTSTTTTPGLSLTTTTVSGLKPTIDGTCDVTASAHAASSSAGKVQSVTCNGNGELSILIHLPAGDSAFNISVAASYADGKSAVRTQTIQRTPFLCPAGYVGVPGSGIPGLGNASASKGNSNWWLDVDSDFCVMKYPAKNNNGSTYATSTIAGAPWVDIQRGADENTTGSAFKACKEAGTGYRLISNTQWQTVAINLESMGVNWSGGSVGSGSMTLGQKQILTNSETVVDFGGNVQQWVSDESASLGLNPFIGSGYQEFTDAIFPTSGTNAGVNRLIYAPLGNFDSSKGVGQVYGGTGAVRRGGAGQDNQFAGPFWAATNYAQWMIRSEVGFRC